MAKIFRNLQLRKQLGSRIRAWLYTLSHNSLIKALAAIFVLAFTAAILVSYFEQGINPAFQHITSGFWWAIVTMTTVGYGDMVPQTGPGRLVATLVMLSGVVLLSVFTAAVSTNVITNRLKEGKGLKKLNLKNHIALLGWNAAAPEIIQAISAGMIQENRTLVLVNQMDPDHMEGIINRFQGVQIKFVSGDFSDEEVLNRAGIANAHAAIILPDESVPGKPKTDEHTILATLSVKAIEPKVRVIAHILDPANEPHMRRANADRVVVSDRYSGYLLSAHVTSPGIPEMLDGLFTGEAGVHLTRRKMPHHLVGKSFAQASAHFLEQDNVLLIGLLSEEEGFKLDDILSDDYSAVDRFIREKLASAGKGLSKRDTLSVNLKPAANYVIEPQDIAIVLERS